MQGKGGGPRTAEGRARSSRNAVKHGVHSPHPFIIEDLESPAEWDEFKLGIIESWEPVGRYEQELAERIAFHQWRLRRSALHETIQLNGQVAETEYELQQSDADEDDDDDDDDDTEQKPWPEIEPDRLLAHQHFKVIPNGRSIDRILRYETHVSKHLFQTVHELEVRQAHRRGERTPLARVDFNSAPTLAPPRRAPSNTAAIRQLNQHISRNVSRAEGALAERERAAQKDG